jgi:outer membrane immunogenic protein
MRKLLLASLAGVALVAGASANAADLGTRMPVKALPAAAPVPVFTWTGFYLGGHVGYLWGDVDVEHVEVAPAAPATGGPTNGVVGGVLGGANWQTGPLVFGGEADIGWSNAHGNGAVALTPEFFQYQIRWTAHARGRIGYAFGGTLVYIAGGLAVAHADVQEIMENTILPCQVGGTYTGGSIGGGVEQAFTRQISGRIEYLYDNFGHKTYTMGDDAYRVGVTGQTVRGAVVFRFGP